MINPNAPPPAPTPPPAAVPPPAPPPVEPAPAAPAVPVPDVERAKLGYAFRLKKREILLDKGALALVLAVVSGALGWWVNRSLEQDKAQQARLLADQQGKLNLVLEDYRGTQARERFLVEKRYEAIHAVMKSCGKLTAYLLDYRQKVIPATPAKRDEYRDIIDDVRNTNNSYDVEVPYEFERELDKYLFLHRGFVTNKFPEDQHPFLFAMAVQFKALAQRTVGPDGGARRPEFALGPLPAESTNATAAAYADAQFKQWKEWKAKHPD